MLASFSVKKKQHIVLNRPSSSARIFMVHVSLGFRVGTWLQWLLIANQDHGSEPPDFIRMAPAQTQDLRGFVR